VFYQVKNIESVKATIRFWLFLSIFCSAWIVFQLINPLYSGGTYGPSLFWERGPLPSGGFFLILFSTLFNVFIYNYLSSNISRAKKTIIGAIILFLATGVISSGSRTAIFGLFLATVLSLFLYQIRRRTTKVFLISFFIPLIILTIFFIVSEEVPYGRILIHPVSAIGPRIAIWQAQISLFLKNPFDIFFGLGKSVLLATEESHGQYVRNFIETGIVGSLAFFFLIFSIIRRAWRELLLGGSLIKTGLSAGLLVNTFVMLFISIVAEGFLVVKPNEVYWFFVGLAMAAAKISSMGVGREANDNE
jgi:O-antigen ligase